MATITVKELFNYSRFPDGNLVFLILYIPVGVLLVLLRFIILLFVLLLSSILPSNELLCKAYQKLLCIAFGISINIEGIEKASEEVDSIISNQISIFDSFVANVLLKAISPASHVDTQFYKLLGNKYFGSLNNLDTVRNNIALFTTSCKQPLFLQPELVKTNGKALLKFNSWPFSLCNKVQPLLLEVKRPLINVAVTTIDSTFWVDAFFYMFSPLTVYKVVYLPAAEKKNFGDAEMARRLQSDMAKSLKITATDFAAADMREFQKRYLLEQQTISGQSSRSHVAGMNPELQRMANQVKEVLPMVPKQVILKDLARTRNVDVTITNILEGVVVYTPEPIASPSTSSYSLPSTSAQQCTSAGAKTESSVAAATGGRSSFQSFARSANERMMSFQERKALLIANARQRYIEKHGLNLALNNC